MSLVGRWRIVEMELWAQEDVDLIGPGFIEFDSDSMGSFGFIAVQGGIDWRDASRDRHQRVEFSWEGYNDCDATSGRGWAVLEDDGSLHGEIYLHLGDDSAFRAVRNDESQPDGRTVRGSRSRR
ncbi:MAG: hypothetical protein M0008_13115 [Actinomycetota bacterium]|jgi:hypothetical protein|nr:hypothetical protein [Actinomycetota bacterium]